MKRASLHVKFQDGEAAEWTIRADTLVSDEEFLRFQTIVNNDVRLLWSRIKSILVYAISDGPAVQTEDSTATLSQGQQTP